MFFYVSQLWRFGWRSHMAKRTDLDFLPILSLSGKSCRVLSPRGTSQQVLSSHCRQALPGSPRTWGIRYYMAPEICMQLDQPYLSRWLFNTRDAILSPAVSHMCQRALSEGHCLLLCAALCWNLRIWSEWSEWPVMFIFSFYCALQVQLIMGNTVTTICTSS